MLHGSSSSSTKLFKNFRVDAQQLPQNGLQESDYLIRYNDGQVGTLTASEFKSSFSRRDTRAAPAALHDGCMCGGAEVEKMVHVILRDDDDDDPFRIFQRFPSQSQHNGP